MRSDMGAIPPRQLRGGEGWELSCVQLGLSECKCLRSTSSTNVGSLQTARCSVDLAQPRSIGSEALWVVPTYIFPSLDISDV